MLGGMVKKLIIVTGEKESVYAELLSSLISLKDDDTENNQVIGIKDESVEAVVFGVVSLTMGNSRFPLADCLVGNI